jgi:hypothetical protein
VRHAVQRWRVPLVMATVLGEPPPPCDDRRWVYRYARRARNGSILLLHDTYPHTADALPDLIRLLKARGYRSPPFQRWWMRCNKGLAGNTIDVKNSAVQGKNLLCEVKQRCKSIRL